MEPFDMEGFCRAINIAGCCINEECDSCPIGECDFRVGTVEVPKKMLRLIIDRMEEARKELDRRDDIIQDYEGIETVAFREGAEKGWKTAGRIVGEISEGGLGVDKIREIFYIGHKDNFFRKNVLKDFGAWEAIEKIDEYDKNRIHVGDEVEIQGERLIVCYACDQYILGTDGEKNFQGAPDSFVKTGRHFDQLDEAFALLKKGEQDEQAIQH